MQCSSYIAGQWCDAPTATMVELGDPADAKTVVSRSVHASADDAVHAVNAAVALRSVWRNRPLAQRLDDVERVVSFILDRRGSFAAAICSETGKTRRESEQEIDATLAEARAQMRTFASGLVENIAGHKLAYEPLGAVLLVTPSNFPLAAVMRKLVPALLAGNTVVVKASELTPLTGRCLFAAIDAAGLPDGVANLVLADGRKVVGPMIGTNEIDAVSLTGSTDTGAAIAKLIGDRNIRLQAETGGSNAVVVLADADLDAAVEAAVAHGFSCCGQWCTGTSRVIVEAAIFEKFATRLTEAAARIAVGPGTDAATDMGPLISARQRKRVEAAIAALLGTGAQVLCGGGRPAGDEFRDGWFFEPTVLSVSPETEVDEIFGPVILLSEASDAASAIEQANASRYGLSFSVYTRDPVRAEWAVAEAQAGLCHVNLGTGFRDSALPLLGWKASGRGMPECGRFARDFFTRTKAIYREAG